MNGISSPPDVERTQPVPIAAEVRAALERFAEETRESYVRKARVSSLRLGINTIDLAPEGAVNAAWVVLCKRLQRGKIEPIVDREQFDKIFTLLLFHVLVSAWRRQHAASVAVRWERWFTSPTWKKPASMRSTSTPARRGRATETKSEADSLVDLLRGEGEWLRAIALLKIEGLTNREIASTLGRPIWDVKRSLDKIRTILRPLLDHRG